MRPSKCLRTLHIVGSLLGVYLVEYGWLEKEAWEYKEPD